MFSKHFFKMLLGLIVMILIGILGLFIINAYESAHGRNVQSVGVGAGSYLPELH